MGTKVIETFQIELQDFINEKVPTRNYQKYFMVEREYIKNLSWEMVVNYSYMSLHSESIKVKK